MTVLHLRLVRSSANCLCLELYIGVALGCELKLVMFEIEWQLVLSSDVLDEEWS